LLVAVTRTGLGLAASSLPDVFLLGLRRCDLRLEWLVGVLGDPESMEENSELSSDGNDGSFLRGLATASGESEAVAAQIAVLAERPEDVVGALHEQLAKEGITFTRDVELGISLAGASRCWGEPEVSADGAALGEACWVLEDQHVGERGECADAMDLSEPGGVGVLPCELSDGSVVLVNALAERGEELDDRLQSGGELARESLSGDLG
jgi:hypothetical protein